MKSEDVALIVRAISFSKISNLCGPDPPTSQTDRQDGWMDRQTTCNRNTALCTKVHHAVKMLGFTPCYSRPYSRCPLSELSVTVCWSNISCRLDVLPGTQPTVSRNHEIMIYCGSKRWHHLYFIAITFFYCWPTFIILADVQYKKITTKRCRVSQSNIVCVTALRYKILITISPICTCSLQLIHSKYEKHLL